MANVLENGRSGLVLVGEGKGRALIPRGSPLTRLNYFDGKLLRAEDLRTEQEYVRRLVQLSNRAGGGGVVHGFDLTLGAGDELQVGAGMAVDGEGRVLLLPVEAEVGVGGLLEASRRAGGRAVRLADDGSGRFVECELPDEDPEEEGLPARGLYLVVVVHAEALCGQEDVYGRLCERACETETQRPYRVEGVSLRLIPLSLGSPLPGSSAVTLDRRHLRSRVASAFFRDEDRVPGHLLSRTGLTSRTWCRGADYLDGRHVPLGVLGRQGDTTLFLDAWTSRRERMESPPRRYWAGRMAMRPWNAYLAQILQFQCQLVDALGRIPEPGAVDDPCQDEKEALAEARRYLQKLEESLAGESEEEASGGQGGAGFEGGGGMFSAADLEAAFPGGIAELNVVSRQLMAALESFRGAGSRQVLLDGGIVELPPAGYLPVVPDSPVSVNRQVRDLVGRGVDLRFCVVRPDFVAHALEEVQHMERISLLEGLADPVSMPEVDVLVPDGTVRPGAGATGLYDVTLEVTPPANAYGDVTEVRNAEFSSPTHHSTGGVVELPSATVRGVARALDRDGEGGILRWAGSPSALPPALARLLGEALGDVFEEERDGEEAEDGSGAGTVGGADVRHDRINLAVEADIRTVDRTLEELEAGAWATLRYDADPFALEAGDPLPCTLKAALGAAAEGQAGTVEVEAEGTLQVGSVAGDDGSGERTVEGRFRRVVLLLKPTLDGDPLPVESTSIALSAEFRLRGPMDGPTSLVLRLSHESGTAVTVTGVRKEDHVDGVLRIRSVETIEDESRIEEVGPASEGVIRGVVRTLEDGNPLAGVQVVIEGTERGALTDADGGFVLRDVLGTDQRVVVSHVGLQTAEIVLDVVDGEPGTELEVLLAPEDATTDERVFEPATATAERDDRVLENDHPAHQRAVAALELIGRGLDDPAFQPRAEAELFQRERPEEGPPVHATREWVLFHRRRVKECAPRPTRPAPTRDRRYRVYHVGLAGDDGGEDEVSAMLDEAEELVRVGDLNGALAIVNQVRVARGAEPLTIQDVEELMQAIEEERARLGSSESDVEGLLEALRSDDPGALTEFGPVEVGPVTFSGDGVSLTTPAASVLDAWREAGPGGSIVLGAIASRGEAAEDGPVLAEGRLDRLEATLGQATPLHADATSVRLPALPPGLDVTGADGVVVVATGAGEPPEEPEEEPATTTHLVVGVEGEEGISFSRDDIGDAITEEFLAEVGTILGRVDFPVGGTTPDSAGMAAIDAGWDSAFPGMTAGGALVFAAPDETEPREAQAEALIQGLDGISDAMIRVLDVPEDVGMPADAITMVVAGRERTARIVAYEAVDGGREILLRDGSLVVDFEVDGTLEEPLTDAQVDLLAGLNMRYDRVELAVPETPDNRPARARLQSIVQELQGRGLLVDAPSSEVVQLSSDEQDLLTLPDDNTVDEVVFLEVQRPG